MKKRHLLAALLLSLGTTPAQGNYSNFEEPLVKPIAIAPFQGTELLLVCNTPDNSVEIYNTVGMTFHSRVRVGLSPVSIRFHAGTGRFYTANLIGDSVSAVQLVPVGSGLEARLLITREVGDEPSDIAISADGTQVFVTLATRGAVVGLDASTLAPLGALYPFSLRVQKPDGSADVMREPRRIEFVGGRPLALNFKGGKALPPNSPAIFAASFSRPYDLDTVAFDPTTGASDALGGLGTTNAGMTVAKDGSLWVVGSVALFDIQHEPTLKNQLTGFVQSWIWRVTQPGTSGATIASARDLNLNGGQAAAESLSVSQPQDVILIEDDANQVQKVFVAAFGSDRLLVLTPGGANLANWPTASLTIPQANGATYTHSGPRGLALSQDKTRLYCLNRLNHSISVIDTDLQNPLSPGIHLQQLALKNDPTPTVIRKGRGFLYSAQFSGNKKVACASCHFDGRTDSLSWNLGSHDPSGLGVAKPEQLPDRTPPVSGPGPFPTLKGYMVTQTLQGLVDSYVNPDSQELFTNAPYHWRGDRASFEDFNQGFVGLLGMTDIAGSGSATPKGLTDTQMTDYRRMIDTILLPPNPQQPRTRIYSGTLGNANDVNDGTAARRGLKAFHIKEIFRCQGRSCVQCHALPSGSNLRITLDGPGAVGEMTNAGGLETTRLRSLASREGRLEFPTIGQSNDFLGMFGLTHGGVQLVPNFPGLIPGPKSIDRFVIDEFNNNSPLQQDIARFVREFDAGIAPVIGTVTTIDATLVTVPRIVLTLDLLEAQARDAEAGVVMQARIGTTDRGFYFDLTAGANGLYREEGMAATFSRDQLLTLLTLPTDRIVAFATPPGNERRIASLTGVAQSLAGQGAAAPTAIRLLPLEVPNPWKDVPLLFDNWDPFAALPLDPFIDADIAQGELRSLKTVRIFQRALMLVPGSGVTGLRHEAPRRFRVAGQNIRPGARLQVRVPRPTIPGTPPPYPNVRVQSRLIDVPIYPTNELDQGDRVWKSHALLAPPVAYALMLGGPDAQGVKFAIEEPDQITEPSLSGVTFDAATWNRHHVLVQNEDGTFGVASTLQALRMN